MTKQSRRILVEDASLRVPSGAALHCHRIEREEVNQWSSIVVPYSRLNSPLGPSRQRSKLRDSASLSAREAASVQDDGKMRAKVKASSLP